MIRVGFTFPYAGAGWVGGFVYVRNLLSAIRSRPDRTIEPVLLAPREVLDSHLKGFEGIEVIKTVLLADGKRMRDLRKLKEEAVAVLGRDLLFEGLLERHGLQLLSHSPPLGPRARVPTVAWIPDFQHVRLPDLFQAKDLQKRDRAFRRVADWCSTLVLSSADAQRDLSAFAPAAAAKSRILHFVASPAAGEAPKGKDFLAQTYDIRQPYFFLPNQFWRHKNHRLVVDALGLLAKRGRAPLVVSTGHPRDYRSPDHFDALMAHAEAVGAAPYFRVLGLVPYDHLSTLLNHAIAAINPSLFEGWSTTVEEAKSMGKTVILSDIPVHREQAPPGGVFVAPDDPAAMAEALQATAGAWSEVADGLRQAEAASRLPARMAAFGLAYERIAEETLLNFRAR